MVFVFHHLAYFTQHNALQFHPHCPKGQELLFSVCCVVFHCVNVPQFLIHSFTDGHLGCFQHLAIVNCAAMNIGVHRLFWIGVSGFLGYNPSSGIAGSKCCILTKETSRGSGPDDCVECVPPFFPGRRCSLYPFSVVYLASSRLRLFIQYISHA